MKTLRTRITAWITAVAMVICLMPVNAQETNAETEITLRNPQAVDGVTTWDCVEFGNYPQSGYEPTVKPTEPKEGEIYTDADGTEFIYRLHQDKFVPYDYFKLEPIKWRVLQVDGDDAFLLADKNLDVKFYHEEGVDIIWKDCTLRSWLNGYDGSMNVCGKDYSSENFIDMAFTGKEQAAIEKTTVVNGDDADQNTEDKIYLLSDEEAREVSYGFYKDGVGIHDVRKGVHTGYSASFIGGYPYFEGESGSWWLRSIYYDKYLGTNVVYHDRAYEVTGNGEIAIQSGVKSNNSVRPVLHLNISRDIWSYAGTVSSDGTMGDGSDIPENPSQDDSAPTSLNNPLIVSNDDGTNRTIWDCVWFGNYPQSGYEPTKKPEKPKEGEIYTDADGTEFMYRSPTNESIQHEYFKLEPIKWRVLQVDGDDAFLLADRILDAGKYNASASLGIVWENCTLRSWLNGYDENENKYGKDYSSQNFIDAAFTEEEQAAIRTTTVVDEDNSEQVTEDQVYLLSDEEAREESYGFYGSISDTRKALLTGYAASLALYKEKEGGSGQWWLRSPNGEFSGLTDSAPSVTGDGRILSPRIYSRCFAVDDGRVLARPVLHLDLSSGLWQEAGTVSSDGTVSETIAEPVLSLRDDTKEVSADSSCYILADLTLDKNDTIVPGKALVWKSSDKRVLKFDSYRCLAKSGDADSKEYLIIAEFKALKEGEADVTVKLQGQSSTCKVMVRGKTDVSTEPPQDDDALASLKDPTISDNGDGTSVTTWDCIWFGNYPQSGYEPIQAPAEPAEGKTYKDINGTRFVYQPKKDTDAQYEYFKIEPIKWRVLQVDEDSSDVFLLADRNLDAGQYHIEQNEIAWKDCTLRSWLNGYGDDENSAGAEYYFDNFIDAAFTETEKDAIRKTSVTDEDELKDQISLLSFDEAKEMSYGFSSSDSPSATRKAENTGYAASYSAVDYEEGESARWWLRCIDSSPHITYVDSEGDSNVDFPNSGNNVVRPALHLDLSSEFRNLWSCAGTVSSDGTVAEPYISLRDDVKEAYANSSCYLFADFTVDENVAIDPAEALEWASSDESVLKFDNAQCVTEYRGAEPDKILVIAEFDALKAGEADVTVELDGKSLTCKVTVYDSLLDESTTPPQATTPTTPPQETTPTTPPQDDIPTTPSTEAGASTGSDGSQTGNQIASQDSDDASSKPTVVTKKNVTVQPVGDTSGLKYKADVKENKTASLRSVKKNKKKAISIASGVTYNGVDYEVTVIKARAFKDCKKVTRITLPDTIKTIEKYAFTGARKLKTIKLTGKKPPAVKKGAFKGLKTKKMTIQVSRNMSRKDFNRFKKALKKAGFKGKVVRVKK